MMGLFKKRPKLSVQITSDGLSVENADEDFASLLVQFWVQEFGSQPEPAKRPVGFSMDHMSELDTDTMRLGEAEDIEDEEDD